LGEESQQHHRKLRHRVGGVGRVHLDGVGKVPDPHSPLGEFVDHVQGVADGAAKPIQGVNHDHVAAARVPQHLHQAWAVDGGAGLLVAIDVLGIDAGRQECVDLPLEVLLGGRHPGVNPA